jgi:hypothetical protein
LLDAPTLTLVYVRSSAGQTVEVGDASGNPLGGCDDAGTVTDAAGQVLLYSPFGWREVAGRRRALGTDAFVSVTTPDGRGLGWVMVQSYKATPRTQKATLALQDASGSPAGKLEPGDGDTLAITAADGAHLARLTQTDSDRGLRRSTLTYGYEPDPALAGDLRMLVLAAALRYRKLLTEAIDQAAHEGRTR